MVLCCPLSCLMKYCWSSVSDCLQLCVSTCILYVSVCVFLHVYVLTVLCGSGIAKSNSPAMRNAPQHGSTSKPLHVHIHPDAHRLRQYGCIHKNKILLYILYRRIHMLPSHTTQKIVQQQGTSVRSVMFRERTQVT